MEGAPVAFDEGQTLRSQLDGSLGTTLGIGLGPDPYVWEGPCCFL